GALEDFAPHDELLQIAARQRPCESTRSGRLDGEGADDFGGVVGRLARVDQAEADERHAVAPGERGVIGERELAHGGVAVALFRDGAEAEAAAVGHAELTDRLARQNHGLRARRKRLAAQGGEEFVLPVAGDARHAKNLARAHAERHVLQRDAEFGWLRKAEVLRLKLGWAESALRRLGDLLEI